MSVSFNQIPAAGTYRNPFFFIEVDPSGAASPVAEVNPTLMIGNLLSSGSASSGDLLAVGSASQAKTLFGEGSNMAEMAAKWFKNTSVGELFCIGFSDNGSGVASVRTLTVTGTATADGTIYLYINGQLITVSVSSGDVQNDIATAIDAALTAASDLPFTNAVATNVVTLTSRHAAEWTSQIDVRFNYLGQSGGQTFPAGVSVVHAETTPGSVNTDLTSTGVDLGAIIGDEAFDHWLHPFTDSGNLNEIQSLLNDVVGRWAWDKQIYGHAYTAKFDTVGNLTTLGNGRNDQHHTIIGLENHAAASYQVLAAAVARAVQSLDRDPATPLQTLDLIDILPAAKTDRWTGTQRNTLKFDGIATLVTDAANILRIERLITTFQLDTFGNPSDAYLDNNTMYTLMRMQRFWRNGATSRWPRYKLADDDTPIAEGQNIVTPKIIKGGLIADYAAMVDLGWVENEAAFAAALIVTRPSGDPNRVDCRVEPDLINQFRILAIQNRFRLQTPTNAL